MSMLILQRKVGESIRIGDSIVLRVTEIGSDRVKLAIDAPRELPIVREELLLAAETNKQSADSHVDISQLKKLLQSKKD